MRYPLHPMMHWPNPPTLPNVWVETNFQPTTLTFDFDVHEGPEHFRQECTQDGQPCWQDSCVEVFLWIPKRRAYINIETTAQAHCLAEVGPSRCDRKALPPNAYGAIRRTLVQAPRRIHGSWAWHLRVEVARDFLGLDPDEPILGNLYKCASLASAPHYLAAFPISTNAPDFHRPECFKAIQG